MDRETMRRIDDFRRNEAGPIENNLIDELVNGELDRTEFLKRGAVFGLSVGMMGTLLGLVGEAGAATGATTQLARVQAGGTIRVGLTAGGSLEPYLLNDGGSLALAGILGEYLTFTDPKGKIVPWLATSWKPNADATVWTFQLRKGVKFHNGKTMTSADVVASMKQYVGGEGSNAGLIPFFDGAGVSATGPYTVVFRLKSPVGVFLYLVSQTTYQAIIQPAALAATPGKLGCGRNDRHRRLQAQEVRRQEERRARSPRRLLGWPPAARRRQGHVLPGLGADGARTADRADRPRHAALAAGGAGLQEQLEVQDLQPADGCAPAALHAYRPGSAQGPAGAPCGRARDQSSAAALEGHARRGRRSATTTRSGRASRRAIRPSSSAPRTLQLAKKLAQGRRRPEPEVQHHDVGLLRRRCGSRGLDSGLRPGGRHHHRPRSHGR